MIEVDLSNPWLAIGVGIFVLLVLIVALVALRAPSPLMSADPAVAALSARMSTLEAKHVVTDGKVNDIDHDVKNIRAVVGNLPTKDSIHGIELKVEESRGKMDTMQSTLISQNKQLDLILECLMRTATDALVGPRKTGAEK